jgi:hypothetical protein
VLSQRSPDLAARLHDSGNGEANPRLLVEGNVLVGDVQPHNGFAGTNIPVSGIVNAGSPGTLDIRWSLAAGTNAQFLLSGSHVLTGT